MGRLIPCAGAVVSRDDGRVLVVRRGRPPSLGLWSIPGGRLEQGEAAEQAAHREVREETGLDVVIGRLLGSVQIAGGDDADGGYDVSDFAATVVGDPDALCAGDDASDARWVTHGEVLALACSPGLLEQLTSWGVWAPPAD